MRDRPVSTFTAKCRTIREREGFRLIFFCEFCEKGYTTPLLICDTLQEAMHLGEQDARFYFNRCVCCHRWVCDEHYDEDRMICINCGKPANSR